VGSIPTGRPFTSVCPRTGSRVFVRDELLELTAPTEVVCPACGHRHVWNPVTLTFADVEDADSDHAPRNLN
jgi:DNA-directed RNA polymerase subunit RPC12/RpoP